MHGGLFRFKTSWLAREGVFAILFYPVALLFLFGVWVNAEKPDYNGFGSSHWFCGFYFSVCDFI